MILIPQQFQQYLPQAFSLLLLLSSCCLLLLLLIGLRLRDTRKELFSQKKLLTQSRSREDRLTEETTALKIRMAKLVTQLNNERKSSGEKLAILEEAKTTLRLQFQTLAQRIFDEKSEKFGTENKERVSAILLPLQEQLHTFQKRMDTIQANDIRERTSLKDEIINLKELNQQINREAANLTRALKGDKKVQGNWGELVLERVLERSGLRKDEEYTIQGGFRDRDNRLLKPDVIIHLPDNKDIIIDSKVSLSAWEKYINAKSREERSTYINEHIQNLRNHINGLSGKNYSEIKGLNSLDFILLFIPIDSSFSTASQIDEKLYAEAYEKRIIIVTPTTLLTTLKTIENLWRYQHQNNNAKEIADRAGALYDKLCSFLEEMEKVGKQIATCSSTYDSAMTKLTRGRGNLITQAGKLTQLGVKANKDIPRTIKMMTDEDIPN